jgi:hypothetical protein
MRIPSLHSANIRNWALSGDSTPIAKRPDMVCSSLQKRTRQPHPGLFATIAAVTLLAAPVFADEPSEITRPAVLTSLEVAFAGLQVLDVHSTLRASSHGGAEANPVMGALVSSPAAVIASKAAVTVGVFYVSEKLWHRHKVSAILTLLALDSGYAMIAAHNYSIEARARQGRTGGPSAP